MCDHARLYIVRDYRGRPLTELGWYMCEECAASFVDIRPDVDEHGEVVTMQPVGLTVATDNMNYTIWRRALSESR